MSDDYLAFQLRMVLAMTPAEHEQTFEEWISG
jgi:hypothetical protein